MQEFTSNALFKETKIFLIVQGILEVVELGGEMTEIRLPLANIAPFAVNLSILGNIWLLFMCTGFCYQSEQPFHHGAVSTHSSPWLVATDPRSRVLYLRPNR